jgi:transposase
MAVYKIHLKLPNGKMHRFSYSARTQKNALDKAIKEAFLITNMSIRIEKLKVNKKK